MSLKSLDQQLLENNDIAERVLTMQKNIWSETLSVADFVKYFFPVVFQCVHFTFKYLFFHPPSVYYNRYKSLEMIKTDT